jgi:TPR repeat protein
MMDCFGRDVPRDCAQALAWLRNAAEQGSVDAQHNLGVSSSKGPGVTKDATRASAWYRKAADQRNAGAQFNLAVLDLRPKSATER